MRTSVLPFMVTPAPRWDSPLSRVSFHQYLRPGVEIVELSLSGRPDSGLNLACSTFPLPFRKNENMKGILKIHQLGRVAAGSRVFSKAGLGPP